MFGGRKQGRRNGTVLTAITIALGYVVHVEICCTSWDVLYKLGCAVHVGMDRLYLLGGLYIMTNGKVNSTSMIKWNICYFILSLHTLLCILSFLLLLLQPTPIHQPQDPAPRRFLVSSLCTLLAMDCTLLDMDCTLLDMDCTLLGMDCTLLDMDCTLLDMDCTLLDMACTLLEMDCALLNMDCVPLNMDCVLLNMDCVLLDMDLCLTEHGLCPTEHGLCPTEHGLCTTRHGLVSY